MPNGTTAPGKVCPVPSVPTKGLTNCVQRLFVASSLPVFADVDADADADTDVEPAAAASVDTHGQVAAKGVPSIKRRRKFENGFMRQIFK